MANHKVCLQQKRPKVFQRYQECMKKYYPPPKRPS